MSTETTQSAIQSVRDQLSLDYADEQYLNIISQNLGIQRPVFGFTDDIWRALVKAIALDFKQIRNKFRDVLAILFGPQVTQATTFIEDVTAGDLTCFVVDTTNFPQIGTLVIDEGLGTEETVDYCYIDRTTNQIFLEEETPFIFSHTAVNKDSNQNILFGTTTKLVLDNSYNFPSSGFPIPILISRRTAVEVVKSISAVDYEEGTITVGALTAAPETAAPAIIQDVLTLPYGANSVYLTLENSTQFPETGNVLLECKTNEIEVVSGTTTTINVGSGVLIPNIHTGQYIKFADDTTTAALRNDESEVVSNTDEVITLSPALSNPPVAGDRFVVIQPPFTATAGSVNDVTVGSGPFTADFQVGNRVVFDGNVTAALRDIEADILTNTSTVLTFKTALGSAPVAGDTFRIRPRVEFISNEGDDNVLGLRLPIHDLSLPEGVKVELLHTPLSAITAQVQVKGVGWDIFEVTPRELEIYLPLALQDIGDLRSASYLHIEEINPVPATTLSGAHSIGADTIDVADYSDFPIVGVITINSTEMIGYYKSTSLNKLGLATKTLAANYAGGETVELYQPAYASTDLLVGDPFGTIYTFPGPYVYEPFTSAPTGTVCTTTLNELLAGPTNVVISQIPTRTALEVLDATAFDLTNFPYSIVVGEGTGNREIVVVNDVNLRQRTATTVATAIVAAGTVDEVEVASLSGGGASDAANFPNVGGYRVVIDAGGANEEIVYVLGTATGPNRLLLEHNTARTHAIGETVRLMSDTLSVDALADTHIGRVGMGVRSSTITGLSPHLARWPTITSTEIKRAEKVQSLISNLDVVSVSNLDAEGGKILLNYGSGLISVEELLTVNLSAGGVAITVADSSGFPTVYPFEIVISPGTYREERALVTDNNTGTNVLTINGSTFGVVNAHTTANESSVLWIPGLQEELEYDSITGNTIEFSPPIVLKSTHSRSESVIDSSVDSNPRDNGYDFPLRMPPDIRTRIQFLWDLIRAAGITVKIIDKM